jgi:hypothetical protein
MTATCGVQRKACSIRRSTLRPAVRARISTVDAGLFEKAQGRKADRSGRAQHHHLRARSMRPSHVVDQPDGGDDDRREHQAVDPVQQAAVAGDDVAGPSRRSGA